ncbi:ParA family protein [candidate division KSB1 bacterium]|nr:ParA family protein [candidate division KSB1 bacterium]
MAIFAIYSIKGGVGKTATTVNTAYLCAAEGEKTLIIDIDPQGSASFYFRIKAKNKFKKKRLLKGGKTIDENIKGTDYANLDLLPSDMSFRNLDLALNEMKHSKRKLKAIFEPFKHEYQHIFIDCPPNITLVSENIFNAADYILVPLIPTTLSLRTYEKLRAFFKKKKFASDKIFAFFSMVEKRKKLHRDILKERLSDSPELLQAYIPYRAEIERMGLSREPVVFTYPTSDATSAYKKLWHEIKSRCLE